MSDEDNDLVKMFEQEFYKNSCPKKPKVYHPTAAWLRRMEKELAEPSVLPPYQAVD